MKVEEALRCDVVLRGVEEMRGMRTLKRQAK
jgi:hypothetical protein